MRHLGNQGTFSTPGTYHYMAHHPIGVDVVAQRILIVRGRRVMLDRHLAVLYGVPPRKLREQVKRNQSRFPGDFLFQLTIKEAQALVSQNAISSWKHLGEPRIGFQP